MTGPDPASKALRVFFVSLTLRKGGKGRERREREKREMGFLEKFLFVFLVVGVVVGEHYEVCDAGQMGGVGDGETDNTALLRKLFSECDEVIIPSGKYLTHPLNITKNNFVFTVEGTLLYYDVKNLTDWPIMPHLPSYPNDRDVHTCCRYQPNLLIYKASNVTVRGGGEINGQGQEWWAARDAKTLSYGRPRLLQTMYASKVQIIDLTLKDSPFWTTHLWDSEGISIDGVKVRAPENSMNTDGFDPDSSRFVTIKNSSVRNGDDCIAIKSGMGEAGIEYNKPSAHIFVDNVHCEGGFGVSIGSETSGGVEDVIVTNSHTGYLLIKTAPSRGGIIKDIRFIKNELYVGPLLVDTTYDSSPPASTGPPTIDNVLYEGNTGKGAIAGKLVCEENIPCTNFVAIDNNFESTEGYLCVNVSTAYASNNHPKWCHHRF